MSENEEKSKLELLEVKLIEFEKRLDNIIEKLGKDDANIKKILRELFL